MSAGDRPASVGTAYTPLGLGYELDEVHPDGSIDVIVPGADTEVVRYVPEHAPPRIAVAEVRPGDCLVLQYDRRISVARAEVIARHVREALGDGVRAMMLDDGMTLAGVLRPDRSRAGEVLDDDWPDAPGGSS